MRPAPGSTPSRSSDGRTVVGLAGDELLQLGLSAGSILTVDRDRRPSNGDLVWVELVRHGSTQRLVRRYTRNGGWVTLTVADESIPAIMRRHGELLILGVVDVERDADTPAGPATS
jgi:SOS-response transcriptional repressor LexA